VFRACDLCSHPFSFCSRAIQYLGSSCGGFLCNQISLTLMSCASETADKEVFSGSGSPQWNRHMIFQHLARSVLDSTWPVHHRTPQYSSVYSIRNEALSRCSILIFVEQMKQLVPQRIDVGCNTVSINQFTHPFFVPIPLRGSFAFQVRVRLFEGPFQMSLLMADLSFSFLSNSRFLPCAALPLGYDSSVSFEFLDLFLGLRK